ncbi:MAG TPA: C39 family peptidase, partial [Pontiella sp.]
NYRSYPLGESTVLTEPVYTVALYGDHRHVTELSFVFLNLGDIDISFNGLLGPDAEKELRQRIIVSGMRIHDAMVSVLGEPVRDALGKGDLREKVWRWDWDGHAIMLSMQESKYAALRILPIERADRAGRVDKLKGAELKQRMAACVERRDNGDVIVGNIPMIDQGPKGYCSPATWERYLRYMDIPADMYLLAIAANTGIRGGTYYNEISSAVRSLLLANHRELEPLNESLSMELVTEYIDKGLPVMWRFLNSPEFQKKVNSNTTRRNGAEFKKKDDSDGGNAGHICLIVGYNKRTGEIAISDSWGPAYAERWVPVDEMRSVPHGTMNVIKW